MVLRQARIAKAAGTRFDAIDSAALRAGLYHRLVFALRTAPEAQPRGRHILQRQLGSKRQFRTNCRESYTALLRPERALLNVHRRKRKCAELESHRVGGQAPFHGRT